MSEPSEPRVAELLRSKKIQVRPVLGHRLVERVGCRAWKRPRVAFSARLYRQYRIADPWDPESKPDGGDGIGLGPVSLRFEEKREVAPHLKPKEPEGTKTAQAAAVDPLAKYRRPTPTPQSEAPKAPAPAPPPPAPPPRAAPAPSGEFGRTERPALKGPLPQRPDMPSPQPGAQAAAGAPKVPAASSPPPGAPRPPAPRPPAPPAPAAKAGPPPSAPRPVPGSGPPVDPASVPRPQVALGPPGPAPPRKSAPAAGRSAAPTPPHKAPPADLPRSLPPVARPGGGGGGAAHSLRPPIQRAAPRSPLLSIDDEPEVVEIRNLPPPPPPPPVAAPEILELEAPRPAPAPSPAPKPVNRSIPTGPAGLDDIFGMAQEGGRIRRSKKEAPAAETPRKE